MFTLRVANRDYTEWTFLEEQQTLEEQQELDLSPLLHKLFHGDTFDAAGHRLTSPYRAKEAICGVLLTSEKTYGRAPNGKLLYKCVPDAEHLPCFFVPYEEKICGFHKSKCDYYITFKISEWTEKHPHGLITNTFGSVEETEAYLAYQMACKDINSSIKTLNAASLRALRENTFGPIPLYCEGLPIEDRRHLKIISIDPAGCNDMDDALGIRTQNGEIILSIYIANVPMVLEHLNLWSYLTDRIATIYLPEHKIPMLPIALSDNVCSLREKTDRVAFVLDVYLNPHYAVKTITYTSAIIQVEKNYTYDSKELLACEEYKNLLKTTRELNHTHLGYVEKITNSHEVVEYCMLLMNHECAKVLDSKKTGIFRSAVKKAEEKEEPEKETTTDYEFALPELKRIFQQVVGEYCGYPDRKPHALIGPGLKSYAHVTSPIRRLVDVVNIFVLLEDKFPWTAEAKAFASKWQGQLPTINAKTKAIRKLQNEMALLEAYEKKKDQLYRGIVFQKTTCTSPVLYKYQAYIPETKMLTTVYSAKEYKNYATVNFSVHLFLDEAKMTKKVRLQVL